MSARTHTLVAGAALLAAGLLAACTEPPTGPSRSSAPPVVAFSSNDTSTTSGGGGGGAGGGGGGGGGGGSATGCGTMTVRTYPIVVYTTRTGIGFSGTMTNCSTGVRESFDVSVVDQNPDPACRVQVPHYIAPKNAAPGETQTWAANSTLVPCQGIDHTFLLTLSDTRTGTSLATATVTAFQ